MPREFGLTGANLVFCDKVAKFLFVDKVFCLHYLLLLLSIRVYVWGIERSGFFNGRGKWAKGFENQRV